MQAALEPRPGMWKGKSEDTKEIRCKYKVWKPLVKLYSIEPVLLYWG